MHKLNSSIAFIGVIMITDAFSPNTDTLQWQGYS